MGSLTKPYTFAVDTYAVPQQVNANFDTIYSWINANAIWADGSIAFSGIPSGPNSDPTSGNQFTRAASAVGNGLADAVLHKAQWGVKNGTTDSSGNLGISFPHAFATACEVVFLTGFGLFEWTVSNVGGNPSASAVTVHAANMVGGTSANNTNLNVFWLAIGH